MQLPLVAVLVVGLEAVETNPMHQDTIKIIVDEII